MKNFEEVSQYFTANTPDDLKQLVSDAIEQKFNDEQLLKNELLKEAAKKQPHYFYQIDGASWHYYDEITGTAT